MLEPVAAVVAVNTYVTTVYTRVCVASVRECIRVPCGVQCVGIHVRTDATPKYNVS